MRPATRNLLIYIWSCLRPVESLTIEDHSKKYYYMSSESNKAFPGMFDVMMTPYLREILESLQFDNDIEEVIFMKGCQIGGTSVSLCFLLWIANLNPMPVLVVFPTERNSHRFVKKKFRPMVKDCRELSQKLDESGFDQGSLELFNFPGGTISFGNAHAANTMRMDSCQVVILDEVSDFPAESSGQGDPVSIAKGRMNMFEGRRKLYQVSTPVDEEICRISKSYKETDQRKFLVPCPECKTTQEIKWQNIEWDKENPEDVWLNCIGCKFKIYENHKSWMLKNGKWKPTVEDHTRGRKRGYHISALYAPTGMYSWRKAVSEFLSAKDDPTLLKVFTNNILGEPWVAGKGISNKNIKKRISDYKMNPLPEKVGLITAGVDINKKYSNIEIVGWGPGKESWGLQYKVINKDITDPELWNELDKYIFQQFHHPMGHKLTPFSVAIDTGYAADEVYDYIKSRIHTNIVIGIKGITGEGRPVISTKPSYKNKGNIPLFHVSLDSSLEALYSWLQVKNPGPHYCHLPKFYKKETPQYFDELNAFVKKSVIIKGMPRVEWHRKEGKKKEAGDCRRYAIAAMLHSQRLGVDLDKWCYDLMNNTPDQFAKILEQDENYGYF